MATRTRPYDQFGPYILFKKLEEHGLGEVWRAGKIEGSSITSVALHRLRGGDAGALRRAVEYARATTPQITGTSVVKNQHLDIVDGTPVIDHQYGGGRTLRYIVMKARGGTTSHPIPTDQALAVAEKLAGSIELVHNFRREGARAVHGAVLPHLVWIESDGEVQTAGQQMGKGLIASLSSSAVAREIGPYIAPEVRGFGEPSAAGDIYGTGAILYLLLTGNDPPDPSNPSAFAQALEGAVLMTGEPIPQEIRSILQRALSPDINGRYPSASDLRRDLGNLIHSGAWSPTTFNLAFFLHSLLKREFEGETIDREREMRITPVMYAPGAAGEVPVLTAPVLAAPQRRRRVSLIAAATVMLAGSAVGAWWVINRGRESVVPSRESTMVMTREPLETGEAAIESESPEIVPAQTDPALEEAERKKRREEEIQRRLQAEMKKLQTEYERDIEEQRRRQEEPIPERREPEPQPVVETVSEPPLQSTTTVAPEPVPTTTQAPTLPLPVPEVREGDLVGLNQVDQQPQPRSPIRPAFPAIALRQRLEATILVTALISETGEVLEVKVLQGDSRKVGFDEAAIRAVRSASFTPAIKDGKRVRTWYPIPIRFKP